MPVSLWLRPEPETAAKLDAAIAAYAISHGRTPFPAHLTLASGDKVRDTGIFLNDHKPLCLKHEKLLETGTFYQAFAIAFMDTPELRALRQAARDGLKATRLSEYPPHISLTYGEVDDRDPLMVIASRFAEPIRFDRVRLVRYDTLEDSQASVAAWRYDEEIILD